jgi:flagellar L-ring protein precursor FlgH
MAAGATVAMLAGAADAQALLDRDNQPPQAREDGSVEPVATDGTRSLEEVSLIAVEPPEPRRFVEQDLITIIVAERSTIDRSQTVETEKEFELAGDVANIPDLVKLLQLRYEDYDRLPISVGGNIGTEFEGEGEYERDDTIATRVTARVVEVKPNGTLLLESRTSITTDDEEQVIIISGMCRPEDVTIANSIQSSQMYDLRVDIQHSGDIRKASKKGLIPRFFEALFNF